MANDQMVETGSTAGVAGGNAGVEAVAVPMYREPLSGRRFKSEDQAVKHGLKMQKKAMLDGFSARKRAAWVSVTTSESFLETLKMAVGLQLEEWELLHTRKKAFALQPEWKQGEVVHWMLRRGELLKAEVAFEVWMAPEMYRGAYASMDREAIVGSEKVWNTDQEFGQWNMAYGGEGWNAEGTRRFTKFKLEALLPLKQYPQLLDRLLIDVQAVCAERERRQKLDRQAQRAEYADALLAEANRALEAAQEVVGRCEEAVLARAATINEEVREAPEVMEAEKQWKEAADNASLPAEEMKRLVELEWGTVDYPHSLYRR